jgi:lysozyme
MSFVPGIDVSAWEPKIDWQKVRAQGYAFMFTKATQGIGVVDSRFAMHWPNSKQAGLVRGAYHYLVIGQDPGRQADLFLHTLGNDPGELPPVLDLEGKYNEDATNSQIMGAAEVWLGRVEKALGRKPIIYSGYYFLKDRVCQDGSRGIAVGTPPPWSKDYPLWIAQYLSHPYQDGNTPLQLKSWQDWKFWQYSEHGLVDGITGDDGRPTGCDLNFFRGSLQDLQAFANVQISASQPASTTASSSPSTAPSTPSTPAPVSNPPVTYTIKEGDNLSAIATRFHVNVDAIVHLNNISNPNLIFVGQVLVIPQGGG